EIEQNPLLERDDGVDSGLVDADGTEAAAPPADPLDASEFARTATMPDAADSPLDVDYDNLWTNDADSAPSLLSSGAGRGPDLDSGDSGGLEQTLSRAVSLREHLLEQLAVDLSDPTERIIGLALIEHLDEAGYISGELRQVANRLGCTLA